MQVKKIQADRPDVKNILDESDRYMSSLYPDESNHMTSVLSLMQENTALFGFFSNEVLAGIGAVKIFHNEIIYGEIKRVYVLKAFRGLGVSKLIMTSLHQHLADQGITISKLETGIHQPEAIGLYRGLGYTDCLPFGEYQADPLSIFMELKLGA
ncbi:MAG: GNAT family N-acetyltransferase [Oceanospirillaceae bacterium]|nr:GNAT family N-acetyltransferase [Oceanospirillaceae bacterium]